MTANVICFIRRGRPHGADSLPQCGSTVSAVSCLPQHVSAPQLGELLAGAIFFFMGWCFLSRAVQASTNRTSHTRPAMLVCVLENSVTSDAAFCKIKHGCRMLHAKSRFSIRHVLSRPSSIRQSDNSLTRPRCSPRGRQEEATRR